MIKLILFVGLAALLIIPILIAVFSAAIYGLVRALSYETRFRKYYVKYENEEIARMISSGKIWTGQTADQLKDAKGEPAQIQNIQGQEIWLYEGSMLVPNGLRIVLTNGRVQTWS